ncbi:hypothetical protein LXL04_035856 [Taraxacum kok-saghyz]
MGDGVEVKIITLLLLSNYFQNAMLLLAMMLYIRSHFRRELFSIHHFRSQLLYSTAAKFSHSGEYSAKRTEFIDYLINTLGFSKESAISSVSKVRRFNTTRNCDSVIHLLKNFGFDDAQVKDIVACVPQVLLYKANETVEPKIRVFIELGLSGPDLISFLKRNPSLFEIGLHSRIIPTIDYLRNLLGTNEKVVDIIKRSRWLFTTSVAMKMLSNNVMLLQTYGLSNEQIGKFVNRNAMHFTQSPDWLTSKLNWIEGKLGVSPGSNEFFRCFQAAAASSISGMEKKMKVYKNFGFSETELSLLFKNVPYCFAFSEETVHSKLSFYVNELGYTPSYLVTCPSLFSLSLEKRVKPRNKVLEILKERMLVEKKSLITIVHYPELKFQDFLRRYEDKIPSLYETYMSSIRKTNTLGRVESRARATSLLQDRHILAIEIVGAISLTNDRIYFQNAISLLAMMLCIRSHVRRELFSNYHFRSQLCYSTSTAAQLSANDESASAKRTEFVDYLINTLGFSKESAIFSLSKVRRLHTIRHCDSAIRILKNCGFDNAQIKDIVSWVPKVLLYKPNETLEPKIKVFLELGLSGSDLISLLKRNPCLFELGLHSRIIPTIEYLRNLLGTNEKVVETINKSRWLFSTSVALKMFADNAILLQSYGLSNDQIGKFVHKNAMHFTQPPDWLTSKLNWIEGKVGVSRDSNEFFRCFHAIASSSIVGMEKKMEVYRSFGFSDTDLSLLFKNQPYCFALSEDTVRNKLNFFVNELGYTPSYLVTCPSLFSLSLEKRVKPRNKVLEILKERMLVERKSLITLVNYPELRFQDFLQRFEDKIPSLYETYITYQYTTMFRFSAFFRLHAFRYSSLSTIHETTADRKPLLMVDYLIDSLQFSKKDAVAVSSKGKLTNLRSPINSDLVLNIFKNYGLNISQIRQIIASAPKILTCKANKTLEPKLKAFQELGLSGSDLVSLIKKNPEIFGYGLHTRIMPGLDLLRKLLGSDEKVIEVINKSRWLYVTTSSMKRLSTNIALLQKFGLSNERIVKFMLGNPEKLMADPKLLKSRLTYAEQKLGISPQLPGFIHAVSVVLWSSDSEVEKKMQIFKGFGWSDSEISLLFRNQPYVLNKSEGNIREKLEFFMKDLGFTPTYLLSCNTFFTLSLRKRVKPRNMMLKILKEKKLVKDKISLITFATYSELRFLEFLRGFEDDVPGICVTYIDSVGRVS